MKKNLVVFQLLILSLVVIEKTNAQTIASRPSLTVGVINSSLFQDPNEGITKVTGLQKQINMEFAAKYQELELIRKKAITLKEQLNNAVKADPKQIEEYEKLEKDMRNKSEDYSAQAQKRYSDLYNPLQIKMSSIFKEWCQKKGYYLLLDISKDTAGIILLADDVECNKTTLELIKYINSLL